MGRRKGHPANPWGTVDRREDSSRPKLGGHKEEPDGHGGGTQQRHCTIDVIEGQRASETTLRTDTTCVEGVAERLRAAETMPRRLCATGWSRRASKGRDTHRLLSHGAPTKDSTREPNIWR
jgi:hypothetical protein